MSLCQNVLRRGAVYWWRKKICDRSATRKRVIAISLNVREPNLAKRLAALLNVKLDTYRAAIMAGSLTIEQTRALLAHFIEEERNKLDDSIFRARNLPRSPDLLPDEDEEALLIRDQRVLAAAYTIASRYQKPAIAEEVEEETLVASYQAQGYSEDEAYIIIDYLKVWLPIMTKAGAEGFGPPLKYMEMALTKVGAEPTQENIDVLWRQFLGVRGKALGDYERRHSADFVGLDDLFEQSTKSRLARREFATRPPISPTSTQARQLRQLIRERNNANQLGRRQRPMPAISLATRPQRPARWFADAWLIASTCNCSTLLR